MRVYLGLVTVNEGLMRVDGFHPHHSCKTDRLHYFNSTYAPTPSHLAGAHANTRAAYLEFLARHERLPISDLLDKGPHSQPDLTTTRASSKANSTSTLVTIAVRELGGFL